MEKDLSEILSAQRMPQTLMLPKVERVEDIDMVYKGPVCGVIVLVCSYCTSICQLYPLIVWCFMSYLKKFSHITAVVSCKHTKKICMYLRNKQI